MPTPRLRKTRSRAFVSSAVQYASPVKQQAGRRGSHFNAEAGPSRPSPSRPPQKRLRSERDSREPARRKRRLTESESEEIFADDSAEDDDDEGENVDIDETSSDEGETGGDDRDYEDENGGPLLRGATGTRRTRSLHRILSPITTEKSINHGVRPNKPMPGARNPQRDRETPRRQSSSVPHAHVHFRSSSHLSGSRPANTRRGQLRSHIAVRTPRKQQPGRLSRLSSMLAAGSPRKRKRDDEYSDTDGSSDGSGETDDAGSSEDEHKDGQAEDEDNDDAMAQDVDQEDGDRTVTVFGEADDESASEMELNPHANNAGEVSELDMIAESDQYLLHEASIGQLNRLRKAELIRLWKVAGMWTGEDELEELGLEREQGNDEVLGHVYTEDEMGKKELVEGLVDARASRQPTYPKTSSPPHLARTLLHSRQSSASTTANPSPRMSSTSSDVDESSIGPSKGRAFAREKDAPRRMKTRHSLGLGVLENDRKGRFGSGINNIGALGQLGRDRRSSHGSSTASSTSESQSIPAARPRAAIAFRGKKPPAGQPFRRPSGGVDQPIDLIDSEENSSAEDDNATADDEAVESETESSEEREQLRKRAAIKRGKAKQDSRPTRKAKQMAMAALAVGESELDVMDVDEDDADKMDTDGEQDNSVEAIETPERYRKRGPTTRSRSGVVPRTPSGDAHGRTLRSGRDPADSLSPEIRYVSSDEESLQRDTSPDSPPPRRRQKPSRRSSLVLRLEGMDIDAVDRDEDEDEVTPLEKPVSAAFSRSTVGSGASDENMEEAENLTDYGLAEEDDASLLRYAKQTLIRMCEARELATDGTKRDLVTYLIGWRDSQGGSSAPSSASTARPISAGSDAAPPTAARPRSHPIAVPLLLRNHSSVEDPDTPPLSADHEGQDAVEGGLDLEELGLLDREIDASKIEKGVKIGSGGYKDVFIGKIGSKSVAVCEFRGSLSEMDVRELKLLAEFDHPNIVRLLGLSVPEDKSVPCMVITELCHKGDLFEFIRKTPAPPLRKILKIMIDIASGLEYLHERTPKVIHRDCKSSNILITAAGKAKVGDFGLARVKSTSRSVINSLVGTVNWQAPELWHPRPRYDYKVDVFSCGMVFWEMLHGWHSTNIQYPWEGKNEHWIYDAVGQKRQRPATSILRKHWGGDIVDLVERMWAHDPAERPTMTDVLDDLRAIHAEQPKPPMRL